jgi:ribosomal protein S18 acetylase RimI-like enzyme
MPFLEQITPANSPAFKATRLQALQDAPLAFGSTYSDESRLSDEDWRQRATDWRSERSVGYLAMGKGVPCGLAGGFLDEKDPRKAHLISMWVAPAHRREGVGRALVDAIQTWAKGRGADSLLLTVTCNNETGLRFYERNGFTLTGNTEPYPNDSSLIELEMSRSLALPSC